MKQSIPRSVRWTLRLIFENFGWKLLSLAAATAIWALVATEPELSTFASVQVEYKNLPQNVELSSNPLTTVLLELRGPSGALRNIGDPSLQPQVVLDMSSAEPGRRTFPVEDGAVKLPRGVRLVRAIPSQVRFDFERPASATVPVTVHVSNLNRNGYVVASQVAQPAQLNIVGPASHVARVTQAIADVNVSQAAGTSHYRVNAILDDSYVRFKSSPQVEVTIIMKRQ